MRAGMGASTVQTRIAILSRKDSSLPNSKQVELALTDLLHTRDSRLYGAVTVSLRLCKRTLFCELSNLALVARPAWRSEHCAPL